HVHEPAGLSRHPDERPLPARWRGHREAVARCPRAHPERQDRIRVPAVQSPAPRQRARKRRAPAPLLAARDAGATGARAGSARRPDRHVPRRASAERRARALTRRRDDRAGWHEIGGRGGARMTIWQSMRIALSALRVNKLRSALTMLGIIIGVGAVIAMVAVGA